MDNKVKIVEVGPRDGLQNEDSIVTTADKVEFINLLSKTGLKTIEATSFVSPKAIPQMGDSLEVYKALNNNSDVSYPCLVPNIKGLESALSVGVKEISLFTATSDEFTKKNINCTIDESFERMEVVINKANEHNLKIRGYVSTAFGCPYAGEVTKEKLLSVCERLLSLGVYEISIGDTIGVATPEQVKEFMTYICSKLSKEKIAMHFHDTNKRALENIKTSLDLGIRVFDSSTSGLGGCPYANGATGNVATEEVLMLMEQEGFDTGVDLTKVKEAGDFIQNVLRK